MPVLISPHKQNLNNSNVILEFSASYLYKISNKKLGPFLHCCLCYQKVNGFKGKVKRNSHFATGWTIGARPMDGLSCNFPTCCASKQPICKEIAKMMKRTLIDFITFSGQPQIYIQIIPLCRHMSEHVLI